MLSQPDISQVRTYIVHLPGQPKKTLCGVSLVFANDGVTRNGIEVLPEGDHLSSCERLCGRCSAWQKAEAGRVRRRSEKAYLAKQE